MKNRTLSLVSHVRGDRSVSVSNRWNRWFCEKWHRVRQKIRWLHKREGNGRKPGTAMCLLFLLPLVHNITISSLFSPLLFLEEWVWLPLHSCHAVSVGGLRIYSFWVWNLCNLTARLIEGTIRIPAEHSIKPISTELRKKCKMDCKDFWTAVLVYHVWTPLLK